MDTLGCIHAWLICEEQEEQLEVPQIQISAIPSLAILILLLAPLTDLHPAIAAQFLTRGSRGQAVVALQNDLKQAGCFPGGVRSTGYYEKVTQTAVKKLQRTHGLRVDGIVGRQTRSALNSGKNCQSLASSGVLKKGSRGQRVSQLQVQLNNWGFPVKKVDGVFGKETRAAVIQFQESQGLKLDGIVGPKTAKVLWTPRSQVSLTSFPKDTSSLQNELNRVGSAQGLTSQDFEILKKALDDNDQLKRYLAAFNLAYYFNLQEDFKCRGNQYGFCNPDPDVVNVVIQASNEINKSQSIKYKEVELPVKEMLPVLNEALKKPNWQFSAAVALSWIKRPTTEVIEILERNWLANKNNKENTETKANQDILTEADKSDIAIESLARIASNPDNIKSLVDRVLVQNLIKILDKNSSDFSMQKDAIFSTLSYIASSAHQDNQIALTKIKNFLELEINQNNDNIESLLTSFILAVGKSKKQEVLNFSRNFLASKEKKKLKVVVAIALVEIGIQDNPHLQNQVVDILKENWLEDKGGLAAQPWVKIGGKEAVDTLTNYLKSSTKIDGLPEDDDLLRWINIAKAITYSPLDESKVDIENIVLDIIKLYDHKNSSFENDDLLVGSRPSCTLTQVGNPAIAIKLLKPLSQKYKPVNQLSQKYKPVNQLQNKKEEIDQIINYLEEPSINFYLTINLCGGVGDDPNAIRTKFVQIVNKFFQK